MDLIELGGPNNQSPSWMVDLDQVVAAHLMTSINGAIQLVLYVGTHELEFTDEQARTLWQQLQQRRRQAAGAGIYAAPNT